MFSAWDARFGFREELEIDLAARLVTVGREPVQFSAKEYELFVALAEDPELRVSAAS